MVTVPSAPKRRGLSQFLNTDGGISARDALFRAELRIENARERVVAAIDTAIDAITKVAHTDEPNRMATLSENATTIASLAGFYGMMDLGRVAASLNKLLNDGNPDSESLSLHVDALACLRRHEDFSRETIEGILQGLEQISKRRLLRQEGTADGRQA
jgi:hypothetical protein